MYCLCNKKISQFKLFKLQLCWEYSIDILQECNLDNMILTSQVGVFGTNSPNQIKMPSTKNLDRQAKSRNDKSMSMS